MEDIIVYYFKCYKLRLGRKTEGMTREMQTIYEQ